MSLAARRHSRAVKPLYGPISLPSAAAAVSTLHAPAGANYVTWNDAWPNDLDVVMKTYLATDDILVLPERPTPYYVDSSRGFLYPPNVVSWSDGAPLNHAYYWGAMTRIKRGILGLGPQAVIAVKPSSFTQVAQGNETTRYYTDDLGATHYENGCWEKIIECVHPQAYMGNFTLAPSPNFGGVAFNGLTWGGGGTAGAKVIYERIKAQGFHRGFSGGPNGETGALDVNAGEYAIYNCEVDCRIADGTPVGPSPIMINSSDLGLWQDVYVHHANQGMPTFWNCGGTHTVNNVRSEYMVVGPGWNIEKNKAGATFNFTGGRILLGSSKFQLNVGGYLASAKINCRGVAMDLSQSYWPGYCAVQTYGAPNNQLDADITILDAVANPVPTRIAH